MQFLLDTHAFIWWLVGDTRLSRQARDLILDPRNDIFVSSASAWEISIKYRLGKLPSAQRIANNISRCIVEQGFKELVITVEDGQRAGALGGVHRDPFDKMLIAQSHSCNLVMITNDRAIQQYDVNVIW